MRLQILFEKEMKQNKDVCFSDIESITLNHLFHDGKIIMLNSIIVHDHFMIIVRI